jgi:hypothetical protein
VKRRNACGSVLVSRVESAGGDRHSSSPSADSLAAVVANLIAIADCVQGITEEFEKY